MTCNHLADLEKGTECDIAFHERVNACYEVALFLASQILDEVALSVIGLIKQPG